MQLLELLTRWNDHCTMLKISEEKYLSDVRQLSTINDMINAQAAKEGLTEEELQQVRKEFNPQAQ